MIFIIETWRSEEAHEEDVKNGRSWVKTSKHQFTLEKIDTIIPASLAIDVCPIQQYDLHGSNKLQWDSDDPIWQEIGKIGKGLGLKWGGDWRVKDMAHFQAPWS
jgi:hypothetical protein